MPLCYLLLVVILTLKCSTEIRAEECFENPNPAVDLNETTSVVFYLFTRKNPTDFQVLRLNDLNSLMQSNFNPDLPTKIYGPGWGDGGGGGFGIRNEYLSREDINYFTVFYVDLINEGDNSDQVVRTVQKAGVTTGAFINFLIDNGAPLSSFHMFGHSAGAHLVGAAGATVRPVHGKIPRISGLDPADAVWSWIETNTRLDITDAEFVDIMHTNGGNYSEGEIAFDQPMGHVDFYVNGGEKQPGCPEPDNECCSHCRALWLYEESINTPVGFVSLRCDSFENYQSGLCDGNDKELMGDTTSLNARGIFYVNTNEQPPWAMG